MSAVTPQLLPVRYDLETIRKTILSNTVKLISERGLINKSKVDDVIKKIVDDTNEDYIYKVSLDTEYDIQEKKFKTIYIKLINGKVTGVTKNSPISDFIMEYKNDYKIVIVKDVTNKLIQSIQDSYSFIEIFKEDFMMINLVEHVLVPQHQILTDSEKDLFLTEYGVRMRDVQTIYTTDPVARYYNMRPGQVCRIIRPSGSSGFGIAYRKVVKGSF